MDNEIEFNNIIRDIIKNEKFINLKNEDHHGINRLEHSINVAKISYLLCKRFNIKNMEDVTRAALLHDLFTLEDLDGKHPLFNHPEIAAKNAKKLFKINHRQYNAIKAHMFPFTLTLPLYIDSWIITLSDKLVAIYECTRYKVPLKTGVMLFFIFNMLTAPVYTR